MSDYGFAKTLTDTTFDQAVSRVTEALAAEGFGVLTEIDVAATLQKKLGIEFRPYKILGACNPKLAHRAISAESRIGLLLPCNVVVQAVEGGTEVAIASPRAMFEVVDRPGLEDIVTEAEARLHRVIDALE